MKKTDKIKKEPEKEKAPKKETAPRADKKDGISSMSFIRQAVQNDPTIEFEKLVASVEKAGYATKEVSIKIEYKKTLKKLAIAK